MNYENLCIKCMHEKANAQEKCSYCGYDPASYQMKPGTLSPFTILKARYLTGIVLIEDQDATTYIAMDLEFERIVEIQAYRIHEKMQQNARLEVEKMLDSFEENNIFYLVLGKVEEKGKRQVKRNNHTKKVVLGSVAAVLGVVVIATAGFLLHQKLEKKSTEETVTEAISETVFETTSETENVTEAQTQKVTERVTETIVEATSQDDSKEGMIFPDSDSRNLTETEILDLKNRTDESYIQLLRYAVNEIYARHGYKFGKTGGYGEYYNQYSWYRDIPDKHIVTNDELNEYEQANIMLLSKAEDANNTDSSEESANTTDNSENLESDVYQKLVAHYQQESSDYECLEGSESGGVYQTQVYCGVPNAGTSVSRQLLYNVAVNLSTMEVTEENQIANTTRKYYLS